MARPTVNATPNASCSRPVCPSVAIRPGPETPPRTARTGGDGQRQRDAARSARTAGTPAISAASANGTRRNSRYAARARASPMPHRQGPLPRRRVGPDVAQVVDHQQRARQQARRAPTPRAPATTAGPSARTRSRRPPPRRRTRRRTPRRAPGTRRGATRRCRTRRRARTAPPGRRSTTRSPPRAPGRGSRPRRSSAKAACFTARGDAAPDPTSRIGPARRPAASVPRTPSL